MPLAILPGTFDCVVLCVRPFSLASGFLGPLECDLTPLSLFWFALVLRGKPPAQFRPSALSAQAATGISFASEVTALWKGGGVAHPDARFYLRKGMVLDYTFASGLALVVLAGAGYSLDR